MASEIPHAAEVTSGPAAETPAPQGRIVRILAPLVLAAAAGVAAFFAADRYREFFQLPADVASLSSKMGLSPQEQQTLNAARRVQAFQNVMLVYAIFGSAVGLALGLAAGLLRRSASAALVGVLVGLGLGAAFGSLAGFSARYLDDRIGVHGGQQAYAPLWNGTGFLIVGLGVGLAAGLASRRPRPTTLATAAAGLTAGVLFPILAAVAFPLVATDGTLPNGRGALALWTVFPAALMGLAAGRVWAARPKPKAAAAGTVPPGE